MQNSFLFFNIISFEFYTLRLTLFQSIYSLGKVGSFEAFKILIHSGENLFIRRKSLSFKPDLEGGNKKESERAKPGE